MKLPAARVGPYVRALATGLHRLAPNTDYPPLAQMIAHLRALDPDLSGELLLPAEVDERTGMPAYAWLERARAEAEMVALGGYFHTEAELAQAERLDPALGARLRTRAALHAHLADNPVLPGMHTEARARRLGARTEVLLTYDRIEPTGTWTRLSLTLSAPRATRDLGCVQVEDNGRIRLDPGLSHMLSRLGGTPIVALREAIGAVTEGEVSRICRGRVGPFWFPGIQLPPRVPKPLGRGLIVHVSSELIARDVRNDSRRDPLLELPVEELPKEFGVVLERRFAASAGVRTPLGTWARGLGLQPDIVPL